MIFLADTFSEECTGALRQTERSIASLLMHKEPATAGARRCGFLVD
jgi:hypothetical protein